VALDVRDVAGEKVCACHGFADHGGLAR
jgi:hypothetical protein